MRKIRTSTVQAHPACAQIDRAIALGEPPARIAARFGVTRQAVARRRDTLEREFGAYLAAIGRLPPPSHQEILQ